MSKSIGLGLVSLFAFTFLNVGTASAHREHDDEGRALVIALDLDYSSAIDALRADTGGGGALRIGSELDAFLVSLIPEVVLGYHDFSGSGDVSSLTGTVGGRIRFLKILEPGIFAHAGLGRLEGYDPHTGFAFDAGVTLDFTLLPLIDLGLHAAWNRVFGDADHPGLSYVTSGFHVALVL